MKSKTAAFFIAGVFLGLAACGGGDDAPAPTPPPPPPPPPAGAVIGPTGGTVTGPSGTSVVIPAGALASNTTINIAASSPGTPALPGSFTAAGQMFALTPHGTTFAMPVTVTIPLDPALIPAGQTPVLYKTNAQGQWTEVMNATVGANTISGQVTSFSDLVGGLLRNDPERTWQFLTIAGDTHAQALLPGSPGTVPAGVVLEQQAEFGINILDDLFELAPPALPRDQKANGWVMSTPNGVTYEVFAESPDGRLGQPGPIGSITTFHQSQSYIKRSDDARLTYTLTKIIIDTFDLNPFFNDRKFVLTGTVELSARAHLNATPEDDFHARSGIAAVRGNGDKWFAILGYDPNIGGPLWDSKNFLPLFTEPYIYTTQGSQTECPGTHAALTLIKPIPYEVDISNLDIGDEFTLEMQANVGTENNRGGGSVDDCQAGYVSAMLRDPAGFGGGTVEFSGLEPTNHPVPGTGVAPLEPPAPCLPGPGPDPAAGVLQFAAANFESSEGAFVPAVVVTRSGGSTGAVTATYATSDGTAVAGTDYTATTRTVSFADGEDGDRFVSVALLPDEASGEPDKTVNLTLSQPGGCAALGAQTTATLTIFDDDALPFLTVGGTVTGLQGTGLALRDQHFDPLTPAGNGAFTFRFPTQSGSPYEVTITAQPTNPVQVCSIANGSGTMGTANVTNVKVTCGLPPNPGDLDPEFGGGTGRVSSVFGGDETDMLLLGDGKILMVGGSSGNFIMARYNTNGGLDETFGDHGLVTTDIAGGSDAAFGAALVGDKIIVVGSTRVGSSDDFAIVRYLPSGIVDTTFGTQGKTTTDFFGQRDRAFAVAIQPDNRIVVVGDAIAPSGSSDFAVARYDADGALDTSFGGGTGKVTTDIAGHVDIGKNVAIESGGSILVTGTITMGTSPVLGHTGLARYSNAGLLDSSLGTSGTLSIPDMQLGEGLALQPDGKILVVGNVVVTGNTVFGVMRLGTNGFPDLDFGASGLATAGFSSLTDFARDVTLDAKGRILVSGQASNYAKPDFALARFTSTGVLDGSFNDDGKLTVDFFDAADSAENVAVQADGKIVLGGFAANANAVRYGIARVNP